MIKLYHGAILYCDSILRFKFEEFIHLHVVFYEHSVFQSEARICINYTYLRILKRTNFMIWPTLEESEMFEGIKMEKSLKFVPSRLLIPLNLGQRLGQPITFHS